MRVMWNSLCRLLCMCALPELRNGPTCGVVVVEARSATDARLRRLPETSIVSLQEKAIGVETFSVRQPVTGAALETVTRNIRNTD